MSILTNMTKMEAGVVALAVLLVAFVAWASYTDNQQWTAFSAQHNCKMVAETESTLTPIIGDKSSHMAITPGTRTYLCDDGVRYTRSK